MAQPLHLKTVIVPREQNWHGQDIIRFTADYLASDIAAHCIGCYPRAQAERETGAKSPKSGPSTDRLGESDNLKVRQRVGSASFDPVCLHIDEEGNVFPLRLTYPLPFGVTYEKYLEEQFPGHRARLVTTKDGPRNVENFGYENSATAAKSNQDDF